jgi:hypothetical protein
MDEAKSFLAEARRPNSELAVKWLVAHAPNLPILFEALRKAGLPERWAYFPYWTIVMKPMRDFCNGSSASSDASANDVRSYSERRRLLALQYLTQRAKTGLKHRSKAASFFWRSDRHKVPPWGMSRTSKLSYQYCSGYEPIGDAAIGNGPVRMSSNVLDNPFIVFMASLITQLLAAYLGDFLRRRARPVPEDEREGLGTVQTAILTLLALVIGFAFSMAVTRYDQRKNYEEAEANAIGTEYVRADLLPVDNGALSVRELLRKYLDQRILFYETRDQRQISQVNIETAKLQADQWSAVWPTANAQPTQVLALAVSGMNDVLNSQGYTQAAGWTAYPLGHGQWWDLIFSNLLLGYGERQRGLLLIIFPIFVAVAFLLIADIDSPRGGLIRVSPQNLILLRESIKPF